jgi:hypothetical protein
MKQIALALTALALAGAPARADKTPVPRPPRPQPAGPKLVIEVDEKASEARLIVPAGAGVPGGPGAAPGSTPEGEHGAGNFPAIMTGIALALTLAFGGLWLVRRRSGGAAKLLALAVAGLGLTGAALWADIPVGPRPPRPRPPADPPKPLPALLKLDSVKVEFQGKSDTVRLIVSPEIKAELAEKAAASKEK